MKPPTANPNSGRANTNQHSSITSVLQIISGEHIPTIYVRPQLNVLQIRLVGQTITNHPCTHVLQITSGKQLWSPTYLEYLQITISHRPSELNHLCPQMITRDTPFEQCTVVRSAMWPFFSPLWATPTSRTAGILYRYSQISHVFAFSHHTYMYNYVASIAARCCSMLPYIVYSSRNGSSSSLDPTTRPHIHTSWKIMSTLTTTQHKFSSGVFVLVTE